ncbi:hypothetical protein TVAG_203280 [Trichomonas vaginalis G3]|uniref:Uncharacterized protein n=1 Tax=Trichomonas vaginalis (strain ATCC PRA-98 / G3) TaxID=412133 RepID=A2FNG3_TRIV3|nr:hypothetical protein TVAGG3_0619240 [Trichomonas vaginalis G3]EAX93537.1 hypothetical protein TVAG_203280 [Trichomonas vaginalis G3]KAI5503773.1 hypothetical protein TVAGG3_0619240 [Trichomonas vaginalis G3]|eukprot:XP_001306467.1 hypothetical protein [Trichomonas vaginalis G3]
MSARISQSSHFGRENESLYAAIGRPKDQVDLERNRNALLCWMAENWELIEPRIGDIFLLLDKSNDEYSANNQDDEIEYDSSPEIKDEEPSPIETKKVIIPRIDEFIYSVGPTAGFILADLLNPDPSDILQLLNFH